MKKVLIVIGSAREGRAADKVANFVKEELAALGADVSFADLGKLNMPFFNNAITPSSETYTISDESVLLWSKMVKESDSVVLLTPEYNHGTSGILKNAVDWLYTEWLQKPVTIIGYGWSGAHFAIADLVETMNHLKAAVQENTGSLFFMKSIAVDGEPIVEEAKAMLDPLIKTIVE